MAPSPSSAWLSYARLFRGSSGKLAGATMASIVQTLLMLPVPLLFKRAFDDVLPNGDGRGLLLLGLTILGLQLLNAGLALVARHYSLGITKRAVMHLRRQMLEKLYELPRSAHTAQGGRVLHDLLVHDTERINNVSNVLVSNVIPATFLVVGISAILAALNWRLFLIVLAVLPLFLTANFVLRPAIRRQARALHRTFEKFSSGTRFVLDAMDLTRTQAAEAMELDRQFHTVDELRRISQSFSLRHSAYWSVQSTLISVTGVLVLIAGGLAMTRGLMSLGDLVSFYAGLAILRTPLSAALHTLPTMIEGGQSLRRVVAFLETREQALYQGKERLRLRGKVELVDVSFGYESHAVLSNVRLSVEPDTAVGLVGLSGAGKSTIMMLILGFYRPQAGEVRFDGVPLSRLNVTDLRRQIGVLLQDPILFPGTIWDNLTYGTEDVSRSEMLDAAEVAMVSDFVAHLPDGFESRVGDDGVLLSGGQRQKIVLARALARRPPFLILDEPTNHLDAVTVQQIVDRIRSHIPKSSILIISHDVRVLGKLDIVYRLADGVLEPITTGFTRADGAHVVEPTPQLR